MHKEGESLEASEDSDYESSSEQAGEPTLEARDDRKDETELEPLPVLTMGSFARYGHRTW